MEDITFVTFFFDLTIDIPGITAENYFEFGKSVLEINHPLVVIGEEKFIDKCRIYRGNSPFRQTKYMNVNYIDTKFYPLLSILKKNREDHPVKGPLRRNDYRLTSIYLLKTFFLCDIIKENPFHTTHFAWIDFGISHVCQLEDNIFNDIASRPSDKIKFCRCLEDQPGLYDDRVTFYSECRGRFCGGFFVGKGTIIETFHHLVDEEISTCLSIGIAPNEEEVYAWIYHHHPELFYPYYGDYYDILINYIVIRGGLSKIISNLRGCVTYGWREKSLTLIDILEKSVIDFPPSERLEFLYQSYLLYYYFDRQKAVEKATMIIENYLIDSGFRDEFSHRHHELVENLSFVKDELALWKFIE